MIENLRAIAIFAETIRQGSFRGAAKRLGLSPSAVSYNITELEKRLGTALIYRSTRKLSLTDEGKRLFQHATNMLASAEQGIKEITADNSTLHGQLRISIPSGLIRSGFNKKIASFSRIHPELKLNICYTDLRQNLIAQGIDIAIRAGDMPDSSLKSNRIGAVHRRLVCSPKLLDGCDVPLSPANLASWDWIKLEMMPKDRVFLHPTRRPMTVSGKGNVTVNSVEAMTRMCLFGLGLATPPDYLVDPALADGKLVELLPDWSVEPIPVYAVRPGNSTPNANARFLIKHLLPNSRQHQA